MYSRKDSSFTSASEKMNATFWPFSPASLYMALMSSNSAAWPYCLVMVIWNGVAPARCAASRVSDCLPEPPTPTSSAEPRSEASRREMRHRCSSAASNSTSSNFWPREASLYARCRASTTDRSASRSMAS